MILFWNVIISKILSKKLGGGGGSANSQDALMQQQVLLEQQRQEDQRRRQSIVIAVGITIVVLVGAILAYKAYQKSSQGAIGLGRNIKI